MTGRLLLGIVALLLSLFPPARAAAWPHELVGTWYRAPRALAPHAGMGALRGWDAVPEPGHIDGRYAHVCEFEIERADSYVLDFKNTSTLGRFRHELWNARGERIAQLVGGIESREPNPFMLRHARKLTLPEGRYRLVSELRSPFLLGRPALFLDREVQYSEAIKPGNTLVLICLGVLLGLGISCAAAALLWQRLAESLYAAFIAGNVLYNATALLVLPDVFGVHWFYLVSTPILFSNLAYVLFVIALLEIRPHTHRALYRAGVGLCLVLVSFVLIAAARPPWSLELDRVGVALFVSYGVVAGTIRAREGMVTARRYLVAVAALFVLAMLAISLDALSSYTLYIEHVGLSAVSIEVVLLAIVLAARSLPRSA